MRHIYKANTKGEYTHATGLKFDCKCVNSGKPVHKDWSKTLEDVLKKAKKAEKVVAKEQEAAPVQAQI